VSSRVIHLDEHRGGAASEKVGVLYSDFLRALSEARFKQSMTVGEVARVVGVRPDQWARIESGDELPAPQIVKSIMRWRGHLQVFKQHINLERKRRELGGTPVTLGGDMPLEFGPALRWLRERHGLSQAELGQLMREPVDKSSVGGWETGAHIPILGHYEQLVELFPEILDAPEPNWVDQEKPGPTADRQPTKQKNTVPTVPDRSAERQRSTEGNRAMPGQEEKSATKRHMINWSRTLVAYHSAPEKVQNSVKVLLTSANEMGFTIPELLEVLNEA
jgi:transcriptional regulator with XRE-family HTH domain